MMHDDPGTLTGAERAILQRLMGIMIPADPGMALPSGADPLIIEDFIRTLGRDAAPIRSILAELRRNGFLDLPMAQAEDMAMDLLRETRAEVLALSRVVAAAYYRDDRVMLAHGREPRPPFPKGHTIVQGDWALLDVVKQRKPIWRDDGGA
ncbi:MAG: hypothetical protein ING30_08825 [Burkholderiales bacterium]|nr:hypothetical protein [Burkholderiales bacterium]